MEDANKRTFPTNQHSDPYQRVRRAIEKKGYPRVLVVGASHSTHWKSYSKSRYALYDDRTKLQNFRFVGVGGAKLENVTEWMQGINLPKHKRRTNGTT